MSPSASPSAGASATFDPAGFLALPAGVGSLPAAGAGIAVQPESTRSLVPDANVGHEYVLPHCGLFSPVDFDGSLWRPVGGHNGRFGPLTEEQAGELINATPVRFFLVDPDVALLVTPANAFVLLERAPGELHYPPCM